MHRMSRTRPVRSGTKALPASTGTTAKAALWAGQQLSASQRLAAAIVVMPAKVSSFGSRSCNVRKARSERPRLGRIGRNVADAKPRQCAPDLRLHALRHWLPGLERMEIVTAAVGVELTEQPMPIDHLG